MIQIVNMHEYHIYILCNLSNSIPINKTASLSSPEKTAKEPQQPLRLLNHLISLWGPYHGVLTMGFRHLPLFSLFLFIPLILNLAPYIQPCLKHTERCIDFILRKPFPDHIH